MTLRRTLWIAGLLAAVPLVLALLYVGIANAVIYSGVIQSAASMPRENINLAWDHAYSVWPGRVHVSGLRMRVQDPVMQFGLTIERAVVDINLVELGHKKFHASHIRAEGVTYRLLTKVETIEGREARVEAFPPIEGFARPALNPDPMPPFPTPDKLAALWTIELEDVIASVNELWFLEYRYVGPARLQGGFMLQPLQHLWVGPVLLQLDGGELTVGEHAISDDFKARANITIAPVNLQSAPGLQIFHTLAASIGFDTPVEDLSVAELYVDDLHVTGEGRLAVDLQIAEGRLLPGTAVEVSLPTLDARIDRSRFKGEAHADLAVSADTHVPTVLAALSGELRVPFPGKAPVEIALADVTADLACEDNDLTHGLSLHSLHAVLGEARVKDARDFTQLVGKIVPIIGPAILGEGPLFATATAYMTPEYTLVRLKRGQLGAAMIEGAAVAGAKGWNGAAAGHFGLIPLGLRLHDSNIEGVPFTAPSWLADELLKAGIKST